MDIENGKELSENDKRAKTNTSIFIVLCIFKFLFAATMVVFTIFIQTIMVFFDLIMLIFFQKNYFENIITTLVELFPKYGLYMLMFLIYFIGGLKMGSSIYKKGNIKRYKYHIGIIFLIGILFEIYNVFGSLELSKIGIIMLVIRIIFEVLGLINTSKISLDEVNYGEEERR